MGPSGLNTDGSQKIVISSWFGTATNLVACRLIPLSKFPGLRLIGVGELLRRISGKVIMMTSKHGVMKAAGSRWC